MIYLSAVVGGPELRNGSFHTVLRRLIQAAKPYQTASSTASLSVVFHAPGSLVRPPFTGVRLGALSRKKKDLLVDVAIPVQTITDPHLETFLLDSLREAARRAEVAFTRAGIEYQVNDFLSLVDQMEQGLRR